MLTAAPEIINDRTMLPIRAVAEAAGARSVTFAPELPGGPAAEGLPYVTPVYITQDAPIHVDASAVTFDAPIILGEEKILFLPDSAVLADADAAADCLRPIAEHMAAHPALKLVLAGITATVGSNEDCKALSRQRAEAVKDLLTELGVAEDRFEAVLGPGYDHGFHVPVFGLDGMLNENAPANRLVILLDFNSRAAVELVAAHLERQTAF